METRLRLCLFRGGKLPTGDINRYSTLAYGDLPTKAGDNKDNKYSERVKRTDKNRPVDPELPLQVAPEFIDKIGLKNHLSPIRANGLLSMIKDLKMYAVKSKTKSN